MKFFISALLTLSFAYIAQAQNARHPRAAEIEKSLSREGLELLKGRFPDKPFLLKVRIEPLLRDKPRGERSGEQLPYLDLAQEEVMDEWDDPAISSTALLARVRKIHVNLSVPSHLSDDELAELRDTLMNNLTMIDGRDTVEIVKRNWGTGVEAKADDSVLNRNVLTMTAIGWVLFSIALLGAAWISSSRLSRALRASQKSNDKGGGAGAPAPVAPMMNLETGRKEFSSEGSARGGAGDIRFSDPIKNREIITSTLWMLGNFKGFPSLEDMMIFHKFSVEDPRGMGALLSEFPVELRTRVFRYSFGDSWLMGLSDPGEISPRCLEVLNRCTRIQRNEEDVELEELKILVWRLQDKCVDFFRGVDQSEAFAIMYDLPKSMSLAIARTAYPGSWGTLLSPNFKPSSFPAERIKQLREKAIAISELRDLAVLKKFKKQSDLLDFLHIADPATEKEIYIVAGESSMLSSLRPPFYKTFELTEPSLAKLVPMLRVEEWAQALFNTDRDLRRKVESHFAEKQKFRYRELMRSFDQSPPSKVLVGEIRERIGKYAIEIERVQLEANVEALNSLEELNQLDELDSSSKDEAA